MNVLGQVIGILEPENRKVGQVVLTFLGKVKVTYAIFPLRAVRVVWVCMITLLNSCPLNVYHCYKSRSRSTKLFRCNASIRSTNLPNMKFIHNDGTLWRQPKYSELARSSQNYGRLYTPIISKMVSRTKKKSPGKTSMRKHPRLFGYKMQCSGRL